MLRTTLRLSRRRLAVLALGLAPAVSLWAPAPAQAAGDRWTLLDIAPEDVDAVIALRNGAHLRPTPAGELLRAALATLASQSELVGAWHRLGAKLDLDPEQTFDALLGEEAMYALRLSNERPGVFDWAFVSVASDATAARLERALGGAPRDIVEQHVIRSIEQGRYWLVRTPLDGASRLILAPARTTPLLRSLLKAEKGAIPGQERGSFADSQAWRLLRARGGGEAQLVAFARLREQAWYGATASWRQGGALLLRAIAHGSPAPVPPASRPPGELLRLADDAILFAAERSAPAPAPDAFAIGPPIRALLLPSLFRDDMAARRLLADDRIVWVSRDDAGEPLLALALGVRDVGKIATVGDAVMAHVAARALDRASAKFDAMQLDFGGLYPSSLRAIPIRAPAILGLPEREATLAWAYVPEARPDEPVAGDKQRSGPPRAKRGWWVIGLSHQSARLLSRALAPGGDDEEAAHAAAQAPAMGAPWIASGVAKPAQLVCVWESLAQGKGAPALIEPLSMIRRIAWRALRISPAETLLTVEAHFEQAAKPNGKQRR